MTTDGWLDQQDGESRLQPEASALLSSLTSQRNHVLGILDGLTEDQLRRPVLPSGWSFLGMVRHLTISDERFWFRGIVAGEPAYVSTSDEDAEAAWRVPVGLTGRSNSPTPSSQRRRSANRPPSGRSRSGRTGGCRTSAQSCCT